MWQVVSYRKDGEILSISQPMGYGQAYALWERKNSRSPRRFAIRRATE
jgi:hypothetical protein